MNSDTVVVRSPLDLEKLGCRFGWAVCRTARVLGLGTLSSREDHSLAAYFDSSYLGMLRANPCISAVLTTTELAGTVPQGLGVLVSDAPMATFVDLHFHLAETGYHSANRPTVTGHGCTIHPSATIADHDVIIGNDVIVEANVSIGPRTTIGDGTILRAGAVIGNEGLEQWSRRGVPTLVPHVGGVRLGRNVLVRSNSVIDRAMFGGTTDVGDDSLVCTLVNIAHGTKIGQRCIIRQNAMICGFVVMDDDASIAPSVTVSNGLSIGAHTHVVIGSMVTRDLPSGMVQVGRKVMTAEAWSTHRLRRRLEAMGDPS